MSLLNNMFGSGAQNSILGTSEDEMYRNHMDHLRAHEEAHLVYLMAKEFYFADH